MLFYFDLNDLNQFFKRNYQLVTQKNVILFWFKGFQSVFQTHRRIFSNIRQRRIDNVVNDAKQMRRWRWDGMLSGI